MGLRWASGLAAALVATAPLSAQQVKELGVQLIGTASDPAMGTAGLYGALRTSLRTRLSAAASAGVAGDEFSWRGELLIHFLFSPTERSGPGAYAAGGVALVGEPMDQGFVVATLGLESSPGADSGWFLEAGVGGGARVAAGIRWRWFPSGWLLVE